MAKASGKLKGKTIKDCTEFVGIIRLTFEDGSSCRIEHTKKDNGVPDLMIIWED